MNREEIEAEIGDIEVALCCHAFWEVVLSRGEELRLLERKKELLWKLDEIERSDLDNLNRFR